MLYLCQVIGIINVAKMNDISLAATEPGITTTAEVQLKVANEEIGSKRLCYLGSMIKNDGGFLIDVSDRITKARSAFASFFVVWHSSELSWNKNCGPVICQRNLATYQKYKIWSM